MRKRVHAALFLFGAFCAKAQEGNLSSYNVLNLNYKISKKFFLYGEGQIRGTKDFSYPDYYELKAGLGYHISSGHKPLVGIGRYVNYKDHSLDKEELRIWLQDSYELDYGRFSFENRVRAEKSWFYNPASEVHSDRIRLRYRLNISAPLNNDKVEAGTLSANAYDEVFFVTTENPFLARNRIFGGFSYQIDKNFGLASGYLWQRDFSLSGNKNLHFLYLALSIKIDGTKGDLKKIP